MKFRIWELDGEERRALEDFEANSWEEARDYTVDRCGCECGTLEAHITNAETGETKGYSWWMPLYSTFYGFDLESLDVRSFWSDRYYALPGEDVKEGDDGANR